MTSVTNPSNNSNELTNLSNPTSCGWLALNPGTALITNINKTDDIIIYTIKPAGANIISVHVGKSPSPNAALLTYLLLISLGNKIAIDKVTR